MPAVPERQPSRGELFNKDTSRTQATHMGTKDFATYAFIEKVKGSRNGVVKITKPPTNWSGQH